ncbi:MAG: c-type cytochrome, partial [Fimbriimonadaceae bacterium]
IDFRTEPEDAKEVLVIGKQWMWHVQHMNGIRENNELHVPVGKPVKLTMISQDVIHAMYLPEFRVQYHVVPGRYTELYFTPNKTGKFKMLCGMHCGTQHSEMVGYVYVLSEPDYIEWVENEGDRFRDIPQTMEAAGRQLYEKYNCSSCHGQQNTVRGPPLYGLLGRTRNFRDGSSTVADIEYIRDSIVNPYDRVVSGYEETMPAYGGQLTEEQIFSIVKYIESLSLGNQDGEKAPYEQSGPQFERGPSAPETATDIANERASAGASQAQEVETIE